MVDPYCNFLRRNMTLSLNLLFLLPFPDSGYHNCSYSRAVQKGWLGTSTLALATCFTIILVPQCTLMTKWKQLFMKLFNGNFEGRCHLFAHEHDLSGYFRVQYFCISVGKAHRRQNGMSNIKDLKIIQIKIYTYIHFPNELRFQTPRSSTHVSRIYIS